MRGRETYVFREKIGQTKMYVCENGRQVAVEGDNGHMIT